MNQSEYVFLKKFISMNSTVNHEIEKERKDFLRRVDPLIINWNEQRLPNLLEIYRPHEIERLLADSIKCMNQGSNYVQAARFIAFVARTGYRDEPELDRDTQRPILRRNTVVHRAGRHHFEHRDEIMRELFKIYDRYDINLVNEFGLTHFHVACQSGCDDIVEKFLELGQDPNCDPQDAYDSPLHLAMYYGHKKVVELLLTHGANPNVINLIGHTPLHVVSKRSDDLDMVRIFFDINDKKNQQVQLDARDNLNRTPLHFTAIWSRQRLAELLLKRGADPNSVDVEGCNVLHFVSKNNIGARNGEAKSLKLATTFIEVGNEQQRTERINAKDKWDNSPIFWAMYCDDKKSLQELLIRNGADPDIVAEEKAKIENIMDRKR